MKELVIDVSHWDGSVDYNNGIKKHNLGGVIVKAGGNETKLGRYSDSQYETNYKKAKAAGLHVGAYYYTVVTSVEEAKKDAQHLIGLLKNHEFDMPIYMDVEDPRQFQLSKRTLTDIIKTFCDALISAGYYAGLYIQGSAGLNNVVTDELRDYANGIAGWRKNGPTEAGDIGLGQQGTMRLSDGTMYYDDVSGCTDANGCCIDYPTRIKNNGTKQKNEDEPVAKTPKKEESTKEESTVSKNRLTAFCNGMYTACAIGSLGYDQYQRQNIYDGGECDCSSLVIGGLNKAGFETGTASYTGNLSSNLTARGWKRLTADLSQARPGDILLNDNCHVAAVISGYGGNAKIAQASIDERGCITGGQAGDQTGNETNVKNIYTYSRGWDCILRYPNETTTGYNGTGTTVNTNDKLAIDGYAGPLTIAAGQKALGTIQDGVISGQFYENSVYFPNVTSVTGERNGSQLVKAIQKKVGTDSDGYGGPETSKAIQKYLVSKGYNIEVDGYFGPASVRALQQSLNDKKGK